MTMTVSPMNGECCSHVTVEFFVAGERVARPLTAKPFDVQRVTLHEWYSLLSSAEVLRLELVAQVEGEFPKAESPVECDPIPTPKRDPIPFDKVVAGNTSDARWRGVDPKRWVIDSLDALEALREMRS